MILTVLIQEEKAKGKTYSYSIYKSPDETNAIELYRLFIEDNRIFKNNISIIQNISRKVARTKRINVNL